MTQTKGGYLNLHKEGYFLVDGGREDRVGLYNAPLVSLGKTSREANHTYPPAVLTWRVSLRSVYIL